MSWTPTDEQVEKAAEALWDAHRDRSEDPPWGHRELHAKFEESYRVTARAVLVAVGPHIAAQALRDADEALTALRNPYITPAWLGARAYQIEKEAGR